MATIISPSSPSAYDADIIPTATLALPSIATASSSRRFPPPCWSPEDIVALIDAYKDKWYSLSRGNLRANHWQEVADNVASRCPTCHTKTAVQCRHKMEKLRKRYRGEIQRAAAHGGIRRFLSTWVHFQSMHSMEKGCNYPSPPSDEEEEDHKNSNKRINNLFNNNQKGPFGTQGGVNNESATGFRIKIPGLVTAGANVYSKFNEMGVQTLNNPNLRYTNSLTSSYGATSSKILRNGFLGRSEMGNQVGEISKKRKGDNGVMEVVAAIQALGEEFVRTEKVKMDMVRHVEEMRMEMELKRTKMMLESQQRILESFANAISESKVKKSN